MYAVYDEKAHVIAIHDEIDVIEKYVKSVYRCHNVVLDFGKIKKSSLNKLEKYDDLYLIRYADTYVQSGYLQYVEFANSQFIEDDEYARDVLIRILEFSNLSKKESKKIKNAIKVINDILEEDREYTPSLDELKDLKLHYDPYIYSVGLCTERTY